MLPDPQRPPAAAVTVPVRGLQTHLLWLAAAALVPMLILGVVATVWAGLHNRSVVVERLQGTASLLAMAVDQGIANRQAQLSLLGRLELDQRIARDTTASATTISELVWLDDQDNGLPPRLREQARHTPGPLTDVLQPAPSHPALLLFRGPRGNDGLRPGLLQTSNSLIDLLPATGEQQPLLVALVDSQGRVAARSRDPAQWIGRRVPDWDRLQALGTAHGHFQARTQEGDAVVFAFQKLETAPGWVLVVGEPLSHFQSSWLMPLRGIIAGGLVALVLSLLFTQRLSRRIVLAVRSLTQYSRQLVHDSGPATQPAASDVRELEQLRQGLLAANDELAELAGELHRRQQRYRSVAVAGALVFWEADGAGAMLVTAGWAGLTGGSESDALGRGWEQHVHPDDLPVIASTWQRDGAEGTSLDVEFRIRNRHGHWHWVRARGARVSQDSLPAWAGVLEDIHARRQAQDDLTYLARHDPLTGLANRSLFHSHLQQLAAHPPAATDVAVLCLDLDRFKEVNDSLGHPIGDALLQQVAQRLEHTLHGSNALLARLGGDEFAVVLPLASHSQLDAVAGRLIDALVRPYRVQGQQVVVGASIGSSLLGPAPAQPDLIIQQADTALYQAKSAGGSKHRCYTPQMGVAMQQRRQLELDLRQALERGQFCLYYQPLVALESEQLTGFEALLRWQHPVRGLLLPDQFLPLAEEIGLLPGLGQWVLETACRQASQWPAPLRVAVNLAAVQLDSHLHCRVIAALEQTGLAPTRLELEVTETALFTQIDAARSSLMALKQSGVAIVMDDFGTGYSSLGYLRAFPFDKVKIDKSFIQDLPHDNQAAAVVESVARLCQRLGVITTVEGVEHTGQLPPLHQSGCQQLQGYLFGHPGPASGLAAVIERYTGTAAPPARQS